MKQLQQQIETAYHAATPLNICAGNTKTFYGYPAIGEQLDVSQHHGIVRYEPIELVMTARAGTTLIEIEKTLDAHGQMLAFEPPAYGKAATLGGTIACNFSGPRRPYTGAARDFVLGCKIINGKAEVLQFGGEVMKNVAGYDASRLMAGAMGTLGVLLEVSFKVLPKPQAELTLRYDCSPQQSLEKLHQWGQKPLPLSASCFNQIHLWIRLSGTPEALQQAQQQLGGEVMDATVAPQFWQDLKEQKTLFFQTSKNIWRLSVPSNTPPLTLPGEWLYEWQGGVRWLKADNDDDVPMATLFRGNQLQPLAPALLNLHQRLKHAFDPQCILNPNRLFQCKPI